MQYIVFEKNSGEILLIKKNGKINEKMASNMFPKKNVGIWKFNNRNIDIKNNKIHVNKDGEPKGIIYINNDDEEYFIESIDNSKKISKNNKLLYKGVFLDLGGYANMNRELCLRLKETFDLSIEIVPSGKQIDNRTFSILNYLSQNDSENEDGQVKIIGFTPMKTSSKHFNIFYTMMEPQTIHPDFAKLCNKYSQTIFTPSQWNKQVFEKGGIKVPIKVCPLGVNTKLYNNNVKIEKMRCYHINENEYTINQKEFNFITLFGWSYRKGIDVLLDSYLQSFNGDDDVGLIIMSRHMGSSEKRNKDKVIQDIKSYMKKYKNPAHIFYYGECAPIDKLPSFLKNGDCFLWTSRGEGFGLPVNEAAALNIPVISTYNSAMTEYLNEENSYLVYTDELVIADKRISSISPYYQGQLFPKLGKSVVSDFSEKIRHVYRNYSEAKSKSNIFYKSIIKKYNWEVATKNVINEINEIKINS